MELKFGVPVQVEDMKLSGGEWTVDGYASTFHNKDEGDDIVIPGAFDRTLDSGRKIRFLHSHDARMVLGLPKQLNPDKKGLFGRFKISQTSLGEDTRVLLKDGALDSFSIGYIPVKAEPDEKSGARLLQEVALLEVSLVAIPMNVEATVTNVKSYLRALGFSDDDESTLVQKAQQLKEAFTAFYGDTRELVDCIDGPLTNTKRQELQGLLELCSEMDAVRADLKSVLAAAPPSTGIVEARRLHYELGEKRKRLAHIIGETS